MRRVHSGIYLAHAEILNHLGVDLFSPVNKYEMALCDLGCCSGTRVYFSFEYFGIAGCPRLG